MLYYLFDYLEKLDFPGASLFHFLSFRASIAIIISLLISLVFGGKLIDFLKRQQVRETVRKLGLKGEQKKQGTPTMGGVIIIAAILIPTLLMAKLDNIYIILMILVTIGMGIIGFADDYIKVFKGDKGGLRARAKIIGQVSIGLVVGVIMYTHSGVFIRTDITELPDKTTYCEQNFPNAAYCEVQTVGEGEESRVVVDYNAPVTNVPFLKSYQFDYRCVLGWFGEAWNKWAFLIYIPAIIFIITAVSNAANLTDGIDGLATGVSAIIGICLGIFAYLSGNVLVADYLNIMHLPNSGELVVFSGAFVGACIGFLWYNSHPAQIFMGDTGSLTLGGIIAVLAIAVRKELLIPLMCGIFVAENLSVMIQVSYFKYTKRKYGEGRRVFLMSPLHHHYQKKGIHESKIVTRFWIIGILLAVLTFVTLKIR